MVQVQSLQGVTRMRAIFPGGVRQGDTPPEGWHTEFGLGSSWATPSTGSFLMVSFKEQCHTLDPEKYKTLEP